MLSRQIIFSRSPQTTLTPLLRYCYKLFVAPKKVNPFGIKQIQTLSAKYPGWGYLARLLRLCTIIPHRFFTPLFSSTYKSLFSQLPCFHIYTKRGVFFALWVEFAHLHSQIRNFLGAPPRSLRLPAAGRAQRYLFLCTFRDVQMLRHSDLQPVFS